MNRLWIVILILLTYVATLQANSELPGAVEFIAYMQKKHNTDANELNSLFADVKVKQSILKAIARPAEKSKPWYSYRKMFINNRRIKDGVKFWQQHSEVLARAQRQYGVPAEIIIAILGIETSYGSNVGSYRVADALSTLAFRYPPRSEFFRSELEQFILLSREEQISMLDPVGSYAGAMGLGQFMPSSYRAYAVDFDQDGRRDIWANPIDAIGSIANYLYQHGWIAGESITHKAEANIDLTALVKRGLKPSIDRSELLAAGVLLTDLPDGHDLLSLISLTQKNGEEYWLARQNFYIITHYNRSRMYAMAVTQLADEIRARYGQQQ